MAISYKDLTVWQKAMDLVVLIYDFTADLPKEEIYGLTSQMRRCSVSIPSNLAEGSRRSTKKDYRSFVINAFGSGSELETQLEISQRLNMGLEIKRVKASTLLCEVMKMLNALTISLE